MATRTQPGLRKVVSRWAFGLALISWRYLWQTTPLHRVEREGSGADLPPALPAGLVDSKVQLADDGVGPFFHRRFRVRIAGSGMTAVELIAAVTQDFDRFVPREVVGVRRTETADRPLAVGEELVVEMPGPWNGPVRVVHRDGTCLRLATLRGHLEAGQVQFSARDETETGLLVFEVEAWARPSTAVVHLLYSHLRLAKEMQLNMWVRFCLAAVRTAEGRHVDGVEIHTHRVREA